MRALRNKTSLLKNSTIQRHGLDPVRLDPTKDFHDCSEDISARLYGRIVDAGCMSYRALWRVYAPTLLTLGRPVRRPLHHITTPNS